MTEQTCCVTSCAIPVDDARLCLRCTAAVEQALAETPWLVEQLQITVTREKAVTHDGNGGRSAEKPLPYHVKASEAADTLHAELVRLVRQMGELHGPRNDTVAVSYWLLNRLDAIRRNDYGDSVEAICAARATALYVIDRPAEKVYAGPCECGRDLYARKGAPRAACRGCDRDYDVAEMQEWMKAQVADRLVTAAEGAGLLCRFDLPTEQKTVDKWAERKRVEPRAHDQRGRRLYLFQDLLTLAAQVRRPA